MEAIYVKGAPDAIGPYCHAMKVGNLVFVSGQAAVNPATKKLVGSSIEEQTEQTFNNISVILAGMGLDLKNIVKTTVFLKDMDDFQGMNKVYEKRFDGHKPARSTISVKKNPLDALVEIECIAEM
ncbi:MAG: reactive intermediate/imine deaminase [Bacteroidetes bacterium HGW-Bacteroidetes-17]|nr:MAG: reactive intermediate/imine deaminase [Bacteroidetes bacterium HGW-Bacteroidetes-17]